MSDSRTAPLTMRQIEMSGPGGPEVLHMAEGPRPQPGPGEVLVRVKAVGMNNADLGQRAGRYPPPPGASPLLGLEMSGTIEALGPEQGDSPWQVGDAVCALTAGGAYAEFVAVPASLCMPLPPGFTHVQAAALPEAAMTVWSNIFMLGALAPGESLLVHGGASGIGSYAIPLAHALGHPVFATVGSADKAVAVKSWGATPILHTEQDFEAEIARLTQGRGVDVILDMVGGDYTARNIRCLAMDGRLVQLAFLKGPKVEIDLMDVVRRRARLTGSLLRPRSVAEKTAIVQALMQHVWPLYQSGRLPRPVIDRVIPMAGVRKAHEHMESGRHIGKIILSWQDLT